MFMICALNYSIRWIITNENILPVQTWFYQACNRLLNWKSISLITLVLKQIITERSAALFRSVSLWMLITLVFDSGIDLGVYESSSGLVFLKAFL